MKIRYKNRFDKQRRDIIKTMSAAGISKGLLNSCSLVGGMMIGRATEAQTQPSKSLICLMTGGTIDAQWRPSSNLTLRTMSAPFESVKRDVNFIAGASNNGGHGLMFEHFAHAFNRDSVDVNFGRILSANNPLSFLNLGVETGSNALTRSRNPGGGTTEITTIDSPASAFSRLMANNTGGGGGGGGSASDPREPFVDLHRDAITALRGKLGQHEREKLDSHLNAIEDLERRLDNANTNTNSNSGGPTCPSLTRPPSDGRNAFERDARAQIEIGLLALECNITSSVSIAFGEDNHGYEIPGYAGAIHTSHHACQNDSCYQTTGAYTNSLIARTIDRAKSRGLLDSTLITHVTDFGDGRAHANSNVALTMSGAGVRPGRLTIANGRTQNDLLQTASEILGVAGQPGAVAYSGNTIAGIAS